MHIGYISFDNGHIYCFDNGVWAYGEGLTGADRTRIDALSKEIKNNDLIRGYRKQLEEDFFFRMNFREWLRDSGIHKRGVSLDKS
jgi:hypothetical protein